MSIRLRILVAIMVVGFAIMVMALNPTLEGGNLIFSTLFCAVMVGIIYLHAKRKKESIGQGALFLHAVVASIACSVALVIILQIMLLVFGMDFFELVSTKLMPVTIFLTAVVLLPICWRMLKQ